VAIIDYFPATLAADGNGNTVKNATAQVFALADTNLSTPLALTDLQGVPMPQLRSSDLGIYPAFRVVNQTMQIVVVSGSLRTPMTSLSVYANAAEAAAAMASGNAGAAASSAQAAELARQNAAAAQAAAVEAAAEAAAVGNTNDTITEGLIKSAASKTATALNAAIDGTVSEATGDLRPPLRLTTQQPFATISRNTPSGPAPYIIGQDATRLFYRGLQGGNIGYGSMVNGVMTWRSDAAALPADVPWGQCYQIVTFKGYHYLLARKTGETTLRVFRTPELAANASTAGWAWAEVHSLGADANGNGISTQLAADADYLYVCSYADPTGGPKFWRSSNGTAFTLMLTDATARHHHAIAVDPYTGDLWLTAGDGIPLSIRRSQDQGATWEVIAASAGWQAVQISFHEDFVAFAHDNGACTWEAYDRATGTMIVGSPNWHYNFPVPGGARVIAGNTYTPTVDSTYSLNSFYGAVDPLTGIYYAVANEAGTNDWNGIFVSAGPGQPLTLLHRGLPKANNLNNVVLFFGDRVYCGLWNFPRLAKLA
jgi:hypothetical protein